MTADLTNSVALRDRMEKSRSEAAAKLAEHEKSDRGPSLNDAKENLTNSEAKQSTCYDEVQEALIGLTRGQKRVVAARQALAESTRAAADAQSLYDLAAQHEEAVAQWRMLIDLDIPVAPIDDEIVRVSRRVSEAEQSLITGSNVRDVIDKMKTAGEN